MDNVIKDSFGANFKLLKMFAIYPPGKNFGGRRLFKFYAYTHQLLFTIGFPVLGIFELIIQKDMDIYQVVDSLFVLSQLSLFPFKHLPFLILNERLDELVGRLQSKSFTSVLPEQRKIIDDSIRVCRLIFNILFWMCLGCCFFYSLRPVYLNILTPTQVWWPVEIKDAYSPARYLAWLYCIYCGSHGVIATSAIDPLISGLLIHATGQVKILKDNLRFAGIRADQEVSLWEEPERSLRKKKIIKEKLLQCASHYNDIIAFNKDIQRLLSSAVFIQIGGSSVVICMMCYSLTLVDLYSLTGISFTVYIASMLVQIFVYCFFGNDLVMESNGITEAIYMSDWYTYDTSCKKILILIMERAKKPLVQSAGNVSVLSLQLFVTVLKQAYSLMAVLQSQSL
nr:odorant receptor 28 [Hippodamia variegata]